MSGNLEQRMRIQILVKKGIPCCEIMNILQEEFGEKAMKRTTIYGWAKRFSTGTRFSVGTGSVNDRPRSDQAITARSTENIIKVRELPSLNPHATLTNSVEKVNIEKETVRRIQNEELDFDEGPSTSAHSSSRNDMNESVYSITDEDSTDMFQDDAEADGDAEFDENKTEMLDIEDSLIPRDEEEPLEGIQANQQFPTTIECDLFGEYIAKHLQQLPLAVALKLQSGIQSLVMQTRLEYIRQHPSDAPKMVKQEFQDPLGEDEASKSQNSSNHINNETLVQNSKEKAPESTDQPRVKRLKFENHSETKKTNPSAIPRQPNHTKRTDCTVFAEHIAVQLEQLPEEMSLQLQSEIYALLAQACPKPTDEEPPNRVKIKTETIEVTPTEIVDEYYESYEDA